MKTLLKFGQFSTRLKDILDLYYLTDKVSLSKPREYEYFSNETLI